jgi:hypothetical protein
MSASGTPIFKTAAANATGVTVDLGQQVAGVALRNDGPDTVFWAVGGTPPSPTKGDGRCSLDVNKTINLAGLSVSELSFICATAETATIQIAAVPQGEAILEEVAAAAGASGFYVSASPAAGPALSPQEDIIPCAVDVNGALWAIATGASATVSPWPVSLYQIDTFLQFDGGAWEQAFRTIVIDHTLFASVTETPTPVNCSGKLLLTGIKCIVIATGKSVTLSGDVRVMGIGKAVTPL